MIYHYNAKELKQAKRKAQFREWSREQSEKFQKLYYNNQQTIQVVVPALIGLATTGIGVIAKHRKQHNEKNLKELYCYDRSLGHYWKLRRELTNAEWVAIDKRKSNGERLADILSELKVLK